MCKSYERTLENHALRSRKHISHCSVVNFVLFKSDPKVKIDRIPCFKRRYKFVTSICLLSDTAHHPTPCAVLNRFLRFICIAQNAAHVRASAHEHQLLKEETCHSGNAEMVQNL